MLFAASSAGYIDAGVVYDWYAVVSNALDHRIAAFDQWFSLGSIGKPPGTIPSFLLFAPQARVRDYFVEARKELDLTGVLWLLTSLEGRLRADLARRLQDHDYLANRFKGLRDARSEQFLIALVDDGIFDCWKDFIRLYTPQVDQEKKVQAIGALRPLIQLRHWLAHGRYWHPKLRPDLQTPALVLRLVSEFFSALSTSTAEGQIRPIL